MSAVLSVDEDGEARSQGINVRVKLFDLIRTSEGKEKGYSLALQAARVRAAHQRSYFAPALFNLIPVETDLIGSMAVDVQWRLSYNPRRLSPPSVEGKLPLRISQ